MASLIIPTWISNLLLTSGVGHTEPNWNASVENGTITLKLEWHHVNTGTIVALPPNVNVTSYPTNVQSNTYESSDRYYANPANHHTKCFHTDSMRSYPTKYLDTNRNGFITPPRFKRNSLNGRRSDADFHWRNYNNPRFTKRYYDNTSVTKSTHPTLTNTDQNSTEVSHRVSGNENDHPGGGMDIRDTHSHVIVETDTSENMQTETSSLNSTSDDNQVHLDDDISTADSISELSQSTNHEHDDEDDDLAYENDNNGTSTVSYVEEFHEVVQIENVSTVSISTTNEVNNTSVPIDSNSDNMESQSSINSIIDSSSCDTITHEKVVMNQGNSATINGVNCDNEQSTTTSTLADDDPRNLTQDESPESLNQGNSAVDDPRNLIQDKSHESMNQGNSATSGVKCDKEQSTSTQANDDPRNLTQDESPESLDQWTKTTTVYLSSFDKWQHLIEKG